MNTIGWRHLVGHNMSVSEYKQQFPSAELRSEAAIHKKSESAKRANVDRKGKPRSQSTKDKISQSKRNNPNPAWNKGVSKTDAERSHLSKVKTELYASGAITHWNTGNVTSESTRLKIAHTTNKNNAPAKKALNEVRSERDLAIAVDISKYISQLPPTYSIPTGLPMTVNTAKMLATLVDHIARAESVNATIVNVKKGSSSHNYYDVECNVCNSVWSITSQEFRLSKWEINKTRLCPTCNPREIVTSVGECEMFEFIASLYGEDSDVIQGDRVTLGGKEIDILVNHKIGFEYTGLYWHSTGYKSPSELLWKHQFAYKKGVRMISIFEDEWLDNRELCKSRIRHILNKTQNAIYARKCDIREITPSEKNAFLDHNHIQGKDASTYKYGAFYLDRLVAVMTFKPTNVSKGGNGNELELSRFAICQNTSIAGIANRLFKRFIKDHPDHVTIISYCDRRWNTGGLYEQLGFEYTSSTPPNYWYFNTNEMVRYHRSKFMKHKLVEMGFDVNMTERDIMDSWGKYLSIYDCGSLKYTYTG